MIQIKLYQKNPVSHYVYFEMLIPEPKAGALSLQLPSWRPGRYELGNFAKNIKKLEAFDAEGNVLHIEKSSKDNWIVEVPKTTLIKVTYSFYCAELTAGSCYADENQIYINPIHCCFIVEDRSDEEIEVTVEKEASIATSLNVKNKKIVAANFDELAESPFIVSNQLSSNSFIVDKVNFHLHFNGDCRPDWKRLEKDFIPFIKYQFKFWEDFPFDDYHFIFQITPHKFYHGVEHFKNTVIALGPDNEVFTTKLYDELLGVSCHELFHVWNIKTIRPKEMLPYDYTKENYAKTGFVYEGFTTYYGDKNLFSADVFNEQQYFGTLEDRLNRHFQNYGRFNLSVADSSWDTWLDGYVPGAPYRKTNIYTEGNLIAFMLDVLIMKGSNNRNALVNVCRELYHEFGKKGVGYAYETIIELCEKYANVNLKDFFNNYVTGTSDYESMLNECLGYIGLKFDKSPSLFSNERYFGFKAIDDDGKMTITAVAPYSPSWKSKLFEKDVIIGVNSKIVRGNLSRLIEYEMETGQLEFTIIRNERILDVKMDLSKLPGSDEAGYYWSASIKHLSDSNERQKSSFELWRADILR